MYTIQLKPLARTYKNNGQHAEQVARYTLTGEVLRADSRPCTECGDCGNLQIKSARATVCAGTDIYSHIEADAAELYGYVIADFSKMYIMTPEEYIEFVRLFGYITKGSNGKEKITLKSENWNTTNWLRTKVLESLGVE